MKEMILNMVRMLVEHPDEVECTEVQGATTHIFELRCNKNDLGKVIGKDGKTVSAIRTLVGVVAARNGRKAVLEVVD